MRNIIKKPWGHEELLEKNNKYMFKKLYMKKGHRCSLQYHRKKTETILVLKGILRIKSGRKTDVQLHRSTHHPMEERG